MKPLSYLRPALAASAALSLPALAHAHSGDGLVFNCASGILHPLHGLDHLAAVIAVGVWATQLGGRARWSIPAVFIGMMAFGAVLGANGFSLPGLEPMIAASVLAVGGLIATAIRLPGEVNSGLVGMFALLHGVAHGAEIPAGATALSYGVGFMIATAALLLVGVALGTVSLRRPPLFSRGLGAACAATGFALLLF